MSQCAYCLESGVPLTRDHVIPRSAGGPTAVWNIVNACEPCNRLKDDHVMVELGYMLSYVSQRRARGRYIVYPPRSVVKYIATQLNAMRQGKSFRSLGRGRDAK